MAFNKENAQHNTEDDDDIASEFNNNEMTIAESLISRSMFKNKLTSPINKKITPGEYIDASRIRSLTTLCPDVRQSSREDSPNHVSNHTVYKKKLDVSAHPKLEKK